MVPRLRPAKLWPPFVAEVPCMYKEWGKAPLAIVEQHDYCDQIDTSSKEALKLPLYAEQAHSFPIMSPKQQRQGVCSDWSQPRSRVPIEIAPSQPPDAFYNRPSSGSFHPFSLATTSSSYYHGSPQHRRFHCGHYHGCSSKCSVPHQLDRQYR